eukprot:gene18333-24796_t
MSAWVELWVSLAVIAHVFAFAWIIHAIALLYPGWAGWWWRTIFGRLHAPPQETKNQQADVQLGDITGGSTTHSSRSTNDLHQDSSGSSTVVLPEFGKVRPALLTWADVGCSYKTGAGVKVALQGVYGSVKPGEVMALVGPSGSGKTTLLDILAIRKTVGNLTGDLMLDGEPLTRQRHKQRIAYVPQVGGNSFGDNGAGGIRFGDRWRAIDSAASQASHVCHRYEAAAKALGLAHSADTLVGGVLPGGLHIRGLSGGECKRLAVATRILAAPSVLVLVLSMGRMIYSGPRDGAVDWLSGTLGFTYQPSIHGTPADWLIDTVNVGFKKPKSLCSSTMQEPEQSLYSSTMQEPEQSLYSSTMQEPEQVWKAAERFLSVYISSHGEVKIPRKRTTQLAHGVVACTTRDDPRGLSAVTQSVGGEVVAASHGTSAQASYAAGDMSGVLKSWGSEVTTSPVKDTGTAPLGPQPQPQPQPQSQPSLRAVTLAPPPAEVQGTPLGPSQCAVDVEADPSAKVPPSKGTLAWLGCGGSSPGEEVVQGGGWWAQVAALSWRELLLMSRNPADMAGRTLLFCWAGLAAGLIFYGLDDSLLGIK